MSTMQEKLYVAGIPEREDDQTLLEKYLLSEADFWKNVQEPSTRVSDPKLLSRLAMLALKECQSPLVWAAALVNLLYRSTETSWEPTVDTRAIASDAAAVQKILRPSDSFSDCRWFLSLVLARVGYELSGDNPAAALGILSQVEPLETIALSHGQLYTNVVKATLLRAIVFTVFDKSEDQFLSVLAQVDRVLSNAPIIPINYKFSNEWAYEEVAYVYTMTREIYNWRRFYTFTEAPTLASLESKGFRWRSIGGPFKQLLLK